MENRTKRALRACKTKDCMACPAARQCKRGLFNIFEAAEREIDRLEQAEAERVEQSALQAEVQAARAEYEKQLAWLRGQALEAEQKARGYRRACGLLEELIRSGRAGSFVFVEDGDDICR